MNNLYDFLKLVNYCFYFDEKNINKIKVVISKTDNGNFIVNSTDLEKSFIFSLNELNTFNNLLKNPVFLYFFKTSKKEINVKSLDKKDFSLDLSSRNEKMFNKNLISERIKEFVTHNPKFTDAENKNKNIPIDTECQRDYNFLDSGSYFSSVIEKLDYFSNAKDMPFVNLCLYLLRQNGEYNKEILDNFLYQEQKELLNFIISKLNLILNKEKIEYKNKYKTIYIPFQKKVYNVSILNNAHLVAEIGIKIKEQVNKEYDSLENLKKLQEKLKKQKRNKTKIQIQIEEEKTKFKDFFLRMKVIGKWQGLAPPKRRNISNAAKLSEITYCFKFEVESFKETEEPILYYLENLESDTAAKKIISYILQNIKIKFINNESIKNSMKTYFVLLSKYYEEEGYNLYYMNAKNAMKNILSKFFKELIKEAKKESVSIEAVKDISEDIKRNFLKELTIFFDIERKKECSKDNKDLELCNLKLYNLSAGDFNKIFNEIFIKEIK